MRLRALVGRSGAGGAVMRAVPRIASPSAVAPCAAPRQLAPVRCAQPGAFIAHAPRRIADGGGRRRAAGVVRAAETEAALPEWEEDFDLLSTKIKEITDELQDTDMKGCSVILVGMMGCGKSTLGRMLSNTLAYSFFDTDTMVEKAHDDQSVADIFTEHGVDYFRDCESMVRGCHATPCGACMEGSTPHARSRHSRQPHCHAPTHTTRPNAGAEAARPTTEGRGGDGRRRRAAAKELELHAAGG